MMIYSMAISVVNDKDTITANHRPIVIETLTMDYKDIPKEELQMVTAAFKAQVFGALVNLLEYR